MDDKFYIANFELKNTIKYPSLVMIAKRRSGKSYVTRDFIRYCITSGNAVFSPTNNQLLVLKK